MSQSSSPSPSPPPEPASAGDGARSASEEQRAAMWGALVRAIDAARLYDADHPLIRDRALEAAKHHPAADAAGPQTFLIEPGALIPLDRPSAATSDAASAAETRLARILHDLDAGALRLAADAGADDFGALIETVAGAGNAGLDPGRLSEVEAATGGRIRLEALNLAAFTRHPMPAGDGATREVNWAGLVDCLLTPDSSTGGPVAGDGGEEASPRKASAAVAARSIAGRLLEDPQLGEWLLRHRLIEVGEGLSRSDANANAARFEQVRVFAEELERCLTDGVDGASEIDPVALGPGVRQSLMMCRALSGFQPSEDATGQERMAETVQDLLRGESRPEDVPEAYLERLEMLAARQDASWEQSSLHRRTGRARVDESLFDRATVERGVLDVTLWLLEEDAAAGEPLADPLVRRARDAMADLAATAPAEAPRLLRIHRLAGTTPVPTTGTGTGTRTDTDPAEAAGVPRLQAAWQKHLDTTSVGAQIATAMAAAGAGGSTAINPLLELLDAAGSQALVGFAGEAAGRPSARSPLRHLGRNRLEALKPHWQAEHAGSIVTFVRALGPIPFADARDLLEHQLRNRDGRKRLAAFTTLLDVSTDPEPAFLVDLLADPDPAVRTLGLGALLSNRPGRVGAERVDRLEHVAAWIRDPRTGRGESLREVVRGLCGDAAGRALLRHLLAEGGSHPPARRQRILLGSIIEGEPGLPADLAAAARAAAATPLTLLDRIRSPLSGARRRGSFSHSSAA